MGTSKSTNKHAKPQNQQLTLTGDVLSRLLATVNNTDELAILARVAELRRQQPSASAESLVENLIRQKCLQTGAVGAVTSGMSVIPGLGTVVTLMFGVTADLTMTFKYQTELVLEIAAVYGRQLSPSEKRQAVLLVTGLSVGANQLASKAGREIAERAAERLAEKYLAKVIPVIGVAASAGTNILSTYIIGQRAQAYFSLGPEAVGGWTESLRRFTGMDERKLATWLAETTERSWGLASGKMQDLAGAVVVAGKSAGEDAFSKAGQAGAAAIGAGRGLMEKAGIARDVAADLGKKAGSGLAAGAGMAIRQGARGAEDTRLRLSRLRPAGNRKKKPDESE
ncbi:MAG: DUF697 domain-containing protein [Chloroflexi bacterium]|nr:DUF697 domain-containing protein [Chloroflexota bacterium]